MSLLKREVQVLAQLLGDRGARELLQFDDDAMQGHLYCCEPVASMGVSFR